MIISKWVILLDNWFCFKYDPIVDYEIPSGYSNHGYYFAHHLIYSYMHERLNNKIPKP